jgi:hypothetical protein
VLAENLSHTGKWINDLSCKGRNLEIAFQKDLALWPRAGYSTRVHDDPTFVNLRSDTTSANSAAILSDDEHSPVADIS